MTRALAFERAQRFAKKYRTNYVVAVNGSDYSEWRLSFFEREDMSFLLNGYKIVCLFDAQGVQIGVGDAS